MVLAALDCYCWAFSQGLVTPKVFVCKWELVGVRFIKARERTDTFSLKTCLHWFDMVLAALNCYCWAFSQGLVKPNMFIGKWEQLGINSP